MRATVHFIKFRVDSAAMAVKIADSWTSGSGRNVHADGCDIVFELRPHEKPKSWAVAFLRHVLDRDWEVDSEIEKPEPAAAPLPPGPSNEIAWRGERFRVLAHRRIPEPGKKPTLELFAAPIE